MKQFMICFVVLVVGSLTAFSDEKEAKSYGPVIVEDTITNGSGVYDRVNYAMQDLYILAVYTNAGGDIRFELQKAGATKDKNKKSSSQIKADTQYFPGGSVQKWNANDVNQIRIVGFKGKSVIIRYRFRNTNVTRFYSYTLSKGDKPVKVIGSTQDIANGDYTDSTSNGKTVWIQANLDALATDQFRVFTNKLEGTSEKPKTAKTVFTLGVDEDDVILPLIANKYNYTKTKNIDNGDGTTHDSISIHK